MLLGLLSALLVLVAGFSLQWRMQVDAPVLVYSGWLIDRWHFLPYRDLFDVNLPGVFLAHVLLGRLFGYDDLGCRVADLLCLSALLSLTILWLRPLGGRAAWGGALGFGLWYLGCGPALSLQRDHLALLGIVAAGLVTSTSLDTRVRAALAGLLLGSASMIKPAAGIGLPWILLWLWLEPAPRHSARIARSAGLVGAAALGLAVPLGATAIYLRVTQTWPYFQEIALNYWPLYWQINGRFEVLPASARPGHLLERFLVVQVAGHAVRIAAAGLGAVSTWRSSVPGSALRRRVLLLAGLAACYSAYPLLGGKFWTYQLIPYLYFLFALAGLCLVDPPGAGPVRRWLGLLLFIACVAGLVRPSHVVFDQLRGERLSPPMQGRVDAIARYLLLRKRPGDAAQPLDWSGGAVHAMLLARLPIATPYLYDVQFYHGVSTPYVRALRRSFVERLRQAQPRFVIQVYGRKPWVKGEGTTRRFRELGDFLAERYEIAVRGEGYLLYERRDAADPAGEGAPGA